MDAFSPDTVTREDLVLEKLEESMCRVWAGSKKVVSGEEFGEITIMMVLGQPQVYQAIREEAVELGINVHDYDARIEGFLKELAEYNSEIFGEGLTDKPSQAAKMRSLLHYHVEGV